MFRFFTKLKEKRIEQCLKKNEGEINAFLNIKGNHVYQDFKFATKNVPCVKCKCPSTRKGHDPCIGNLPNVENACCGHGKREDSYIAFKNGLVIRGFYVDDRVCREE